MDDRKQTNTPDDWCFLADRDLKVAEYLAANMWPVPTEHIGFHNNERWLIFLLITAFYPFIKT